VAKPDISATALYSPFFHGPRFQVLGGASHLDAGGVKTVPVAPRGTQLRDAEPRFTSEPLPTEACFQAAGLHGLEHHRVLALPVGFRTVTRFGDEPLFGENRTVRARFAKREEQDLVYDVEFVDAAGRVLLRVDSLRLRTFAAVAPDAELAPAPKATTTASSNGGGDLVVETLQVGSFTLTKVRLADVAAREAQLIPLLQPAEKDHYASVTAGKRRSEWLSGVVAAKRAATVVTHASPSSIEVTKEASGRPILKIQGAAAPNVSIAHAGEFAFATVGSGAFGIDFEPVVARDAAWRREAFGSAELDSFALFSMSLGESEAVVETVAWCAKEAALKAMGTGLRVPLRQVEVLTIEAGHAKVAYKANVFDVTWTKGSDGVLALAVGAATAVAR
jgi:phosphopantetheinyl transferase